MDRGSKFASGENRADFHRVLICEKEVIRFLFRDCKCIPIYRNVLLNRLTGKSLFQSIAKARPFLYLAGRVTPTFESLSRMMGNYQVRFLGDKGGVTRLRYPTKDNDTTNDNEKKY